MVAETLEMGPRINTLMPDFRLLNGERREQSTKDVMGEYGLLLGFIGDIWMPSTVRRILWLQRHARRVQTLGVNVAVIVRDQPHTLHAFTLSSPVAMEFPMLADPEGTTHALFNLGRNAGMLLISNRRILADKWIMPDDRLWPRVQELIEGARRLQLAAIA